MKVLIIEDEKPAADRLKLLIKRYDQEIDIIKTLTSVNASIDWLRKEQPSADLIFMDVRLSDGLCFDIFSQVAVKKPVIFTTAYDEYALQAFRVSAVDYLLKPISYDALYASMQKLSSMRENLAGTKYRLRFEQLNQLLSQMEREYKNRFMIKVGEHIRSIKTDDINLFYADGRHVFILTAQQRAYIVDHKMDELAELLDPEKFFRINRTFIVNINAIKDVIVYSNSRLKVILHHDFEKEMIVSRDRVLQFKQWFGMG